MEKHIESHISFQELDQSFNREEWAHIIDFGNVTGHHVPVPRFYDGQIKFVKAA